MLELTLPNEQQISSSFYYATTSPITDYAIILGGYVPTTIHGKEFSYKQLKTRPGIYWTKTVNKHNHVIPRNNISILDQYGNIEWASNDNQTIGIRPVTSYKQIIATQQKKETDHHINYFHFPQSAAPLNIQLQLEYLYYNPDLYTSILKTNNTFHSPTIRNNQLYVITYDEYEYEQKRYIRVKPLIQKPVILSNGNTYTNKDIVWIEVEPLTWYVDQNKEIAITNNIIIPSLFDQNDCMKPFNQTDIKNFMDEYLSKNLEQTIPHEKIYKKIKNNKE